MVNKQSEVDDSKYVVVFDLPIHRSRDLVHAQCCMAFNTVGHYFGG